MTEADHQSMYCQLCTERHTDLEEEEEGGCGNDVLGPTDETSTRGSDDVKEVQHLENGSYQHGDNGGRVVVGSDSLLLDTDDINDHLKVLAMLSNLMIAHGQGRDGLDRLGESGSFTVSILPQS
jgi:hypothetical protein